jgi:hypothetical protein
VRAPSWRARWSCPAIWCWIPAPASTGNLTVGGRVRRAEAASVGGAVVRGRPAPLSLPPLADMAGNLPWHGDDGPPLVLAAGEERRLARAARVLVPEVVLAAGARLFLDGAELTVRNRLALGRTRGWR